MPFLRLGSAFFPLHYLPGYSLTGCISIFFLTYHPILAFLDRFTYCSTIIHNPMFFCFIIP